jgi:two-component system response regulator RegA
MVKQARRSPRSVLVVDDDELLLAALERDLSGRGFRVRTAATPALALAAARRAHPRFAIVDLFLGQESGLELVERLRERNPELVVIMLSGYASVPSTVQAFHSGVVDFLQKPVSGERVAEALQQALRRGRGRRLPSLARAEFEHITQVLHYCDGNVSEAARRLKIHRRVLQRKLQKHPPRW